METKEKKEKLDKTENPTERLLEEVQETQIKKEVKKKQAISASYTIKAFGENVKRLIELGLIDEEDRKEVDSIQNKIINKWIAREFK